MRARAGALLLLFSVGTAAAADKAPPRPKFSSVKTPIAKCKTKIKGRDGGDPVLTCPAPKGFAVEVSYSAESTIVTIKGAGDKELVVDVVNPQPQLEWRLADKQPYAVLLRNRERVIVRGLPGHDRIQTEVEIKAHKNAAAHAAALADAMFP